MSFFRHVAREYMIHRLGGGRHRGHGRRRGYYAPYGYGRHRQRYPFTIGRPRRRNRVHVTGCCLPIPLGVLLASTLAGRLLLRRSGR